MAAKCLEELSRSAITRGCPNGETRLSKPESSRKGGEPGELKHLSNRRKRNRNEIPLVAASERGIA